MQTVGSAAAACHARPHLQIRVAQRPPPRTSACCACANPFNSILGRLGAVALPEWRSDELSYDTQHSYRSKGRVEFRGNLHGRPALLAWTETSPSAAEDALHEVRLHS